MKHYSVSELAEIAKVSVRTLHYYDEIGLLKPKERTDSSYRIYTEEELYRLQQILIYKELEIPLDEIKKILDDPNFDTVKALTNQKQLITDKLQNFEQLISTIDRTIQRLNNKVQMTDEELYSCFTPEQAKEYREEAIERWGEDKVKESEAKLKAAGPEKFKEIQEEGNKIYQKLSDLSNQDPASPEVQAVIKEHFEHLHHFYTPSIQMYKGLGEMYVADPRFRAFYDKFKPNLADFINEAIIYFCKNY